MSGDGYRDGADQWRAIKARAKASAGGARASALSRQLVHSRFLARVFHETDSPWVLKGGSAVLMRVDDGRTTKDVDLLPSAALPQRTASPSTSSPGPS